MTDTEIVGSFMRKQQRLNVYWHNYKEREKIFFCVRIPDARLGEIKEWCDRNFGDEWIWSKPLQKQYMDIFFLKEEDALLFKLSFVSITIK